MLHNALAEGGENVTLIALWNGEERDGPGGTGDLVKPRPRPAARAVLRPPAPLSYESRSRDTHGMKEDGGPKGEA